MTKTWAKFWNATLSMNRCLVLLLWWLGTAKLLLNFPHLPFWFCVIILNINLNINLALKLWQGNLGFLSQNPLQDACITHVPFLCCNKWLMHSSAKQEPNISAVLHWCSGASDFVSILGSTIFQVHVNTIHAWRNGVVQTTRFLWLATITCESEQFFF